MTDESDRRAFEAGWQPIETAPKDTSRDGVRVDIWLEPISERQALFSSPATEGRRLTDAWYVERSDYIGWRNSRSFNGREINWRATHWMPLPKPPEATTDPKPFTFADPGAQREWERQRREE